MKHLAKSYRNLSSSCPYIAKRNIGYMNLKDLERKPYNRLEIPKLFTEVLDPRNASIEDQL